MPKQGTTSHAPRAPRTRQHRAADVPTRFVAYTRVSTDEQATTGLSMDAQRDRLEAHAKAHEYELVAIEKDSATSGKVAPMKRHGLRRALARIANNEAHGIVFLKLDRLSRSVRDVLDLADEANRHGWHMVSVQENIDTSTATGRMILTVLAALSQMEREQVGERTKAALEQIARQGRGRSSRLPFGYRIEGAPDATVLTAGDRRRLIEHNEEMAVLQEILALYADGLGVRAIASTLSGLGIGNPRTGKPWHRSTVAAIIRTAKRRASLGNT